ncbi:MAG: SDR family NAD(P)-dependent oxidoreductase [Solirubrobacterales bacterium]
MDLGLTGKGCVVTGASRGIGREVARRLCAEGAQVLLVARGEAELRDAASECGRLGAPVNGRAAALACDVTDADAAERIASDAEDRFGAIDVLVNNAGTASWRTVDETSADDWRAAYELNVIACLGLLRALTPPMRDRGWGRVVNVSSSAAKRPSATLPEYSAAKAAQLSLSRLFAERCAPDGVLVNAICPGPVASELWMDEGGLLDQARGDTSRDQALQDVGASRPIGRVASVGEIASAIVYLCSDQASYVAGAAWSVDGGSVPGIL